LQQQATRMLADAKASVLVTDFGGQWFGTYKMASVAPLAASFPSFDASLAAAMTEETNLFLNDFFLGNASFLDAIDAPWTYANAPALDQTTVPAGSSLRAQLDAHVSNPNCSGCHSIMDPIGYALEHFDGIGAWRDKDGTATIDATGKLPGGATFDGALQLASA